MSIEELIKIAKSFLLENYQMSLDIPIKRNNRLRSTHGRFIMRNNEAYQIELAGYLLDYGTDKTIIGVLKHECIHYAQFINNGAHHDGDPVFENELQKHDAPRTRTLMIGKYFLYKCHKCGNVRHTRKKRVIKFPEDYRTSCCRSKLTVLGEKVYDGAEKQL